MRFLKIGTVLLLLFACRVCVLAGEVTASKDDKVEAFDIKNVEVKSATLLNVRRLAMSYILGLDADRLVAPFFKEAGLTPKAENYTNWENTGLDGHICGHYLSALSYMYAATQDERFKERLKYTVEQLGVAQSASTDGYLCGVPNGRNIWNQIHNGVIDAGAFSLNGGWVPLYNLHKIMAGLRDAYTVGEVKDAKSMFVKLCTWFYNVVNDLTDEQLQNMLLSEHGGLNEIFADAYEISGQSRFLTMAKRLTHNTVLIPLLENQDRLTGMHSNTQIPKVIGIEKIAEDTNNETWHSAADFFWNTVVNNRSVTIGGNSVREHFHPANNFETMIESEQGPETCVTYNMLRLTKMLFLAKPDAKYMDYYERAMLNHILSTINTTQGGFVYFTPMRPGHYRVYSQPQTSFWCCVGSGMENHSRYGEMIYAHEGKETLYVNTFVPSELNWSANKTKVSIEGDFPFSEGVTIVVSSSKPKAWTMKVRRPSWTEGMRVVVGDTVYTTVDNEGYIAINRTWENEDRVVVEAPMHVSATDLPDHSGYYSFMYGPMVLSADLGRENQTGLYADDSRGGHIAAGAKIPLDEVPMIVSSAEDVSALVSRNGSELEWTVSAVPEEKYKELSLVPFVNLSEHRYQIYFRVLSEDAYAKQLDELKEQEAAREALEAQTVDVIYCGEQQPETDHQFAQEGSYAGADENIGHWRQTKAWFSYVLKTSGATKIAITYLQSEDSSAKVYCNERGIGSLNMGAEGKRTVELNLESGNAESVTVKIEANGLSPKILEVRTVK